MQYLHHRHRNHSLLVESTQRETVKTMEAEMDSTAEGSTAPRPKNCGPLA